MSEQIHAHKILNLLKATPMAELELRQFITEQYGLDARFRTCKLQGFDFDSLFDFFKENQKIIEVENKWTMNQAKVCDHDHDHDHEH